jgi:hypothetical protein
MFKIILDSPAIFVLSSASHNLILFKGAWYGNTPVMVEINLPGVRRVRQFEHHDWTHRRHFTAGLLRGMLVRHLYIWIRIQQLI